MLLTKDARRGLRDGSRMPAERHATIPRRLGHVDGTGIKPSAAIQSRRAHGPSRVWQALVAISAADARFHVLSSRMSDALLHAAVGTRARSGTLIEEHAHRDKTVRGDTFVCACVASAFETISNPLHSENAAAASSQQLAVATDDAPRTLTHITTSTQANFYRRQRVLAVPKSALRKNATIQTVPGGLLKVHLENETVRGRVVLSPRMYSHMQRTLQVPLQDK